MKNITTRNTLLTYIIVCLWCWAPLAQLNAIPLWAIIADSGESGEVAPPPAAPYVPFVAKFDGIDDIITRTATAPTGLSVDDKVLEIAFWLKLNGGDGTAVSIYRITAANNDLKLSLTKLQDNTLRLYGASPTNTTVLLMDTTTANPITTSLGWCHVYVYANMANTAQRGIFINGAPVAINVFNYVNAVIDYVGTDYKYIIGGPGASSSHLNGSLADFYFNDSVSTTISNFYNSGSPVNLGANGEIPSGISPVFYLSRTGNGSSWATNSGTGGNFTITGGGLATETF